jgi:ADP-ribose pyrophosphatase YjhB (NUDIX family)
MLNAAKPVASLPVPAVIGSHEFGWPERLCGRLPAMTHDHAWPGEYTYCPHCATELETVDIYDRLRRRCPSCGYIHWRNPGVGAAVVVFDEDGKILMVRRGPGATRSGYWSIPAGFVDYGEEIRAAAARELLEETGLVAEVGDVMFVASNFHDPSKLTVGIWFAGTVTGGVLVAGDDADAVGWFALDDLPPLAFETDEALFEGMRPSSTTPAAAHQTGSTNREPRLKGEQKGSTLDAGHET